VKFLLLADLHFGAPFDAWEDQAEAARAELWRAWTEAVDLVTTGGESINGILLAGGKSSRMGGGDKCLLPLAGRPILAHVIERLKPQVAALIISANSTSMRVKPAEAVQDAGAG